MSDKPSSRLLLSPPGLFVGSFTRRGFSDSEYVMSPTSILEAKHISVTGIPLLDRNPQKIPGDITAHPLSEGRHHHWENGGSRVVGLGIVDILNDEDNENPTKVENRKVLFDSLLKIQIPSTIPTSMSGISSIESANSPIEFGIKTRNSLLCSLSPSWRSPMGSGNFEGGSPKVLPASLSLSEMETSEEYTCIITHGPNSRTTHIFDNYIVERCSSDHSISSKKSFSPDQSVYPSEDFLSFCCSCKKDLGPEKDILQYRGEKAICSEECRCRQMLIEDRMVEGSKPTNSP